MDNKEMPVGLTMSLAQNEDALSYFGSMSDAEKAQVVNYIESTASGDEAKIRIKNAINSLSNHDKSIFGK